LGGWRGVLRAATMGLQSHRSQPIHGSIQGDTIMKIKLITALTTIALFALPLTASSAAAANFTWTGEGAFGSGWSGATNWEAGVAPSGKVGTLSFPALTGSVCTADPQTATCYRSNNDVSGLEVNALAVDDGHGYQLTGNAITLGAGGLTASPSASDTQSVLGLDMPITLGAPQTWTIAGGERGQQVSVGANVSGASKALGINFSSGMFSTSLNLDGDAEVGAVEVTGQTGALVLGEPGGPQGSLNGTDGNPVKLAGAGLVSFDGATGPLTIDEGRVQVGEIYAAGPLAVDGAVTLSPTSSFLIFINKSGTVADTDYSQLSATGTVNLAGASLDVYDGEKEETNSPCELLTPGDVDTLITTTGSLTGTFSGVPNGTVVSLTGCSGTAPTVRINYTASTVTATVIGSPAEEKKKEEEEAAAKQKAEEETAATKKHEEEAAAEATKKHQEEEATAAAAKAKAEAEATAGAAAARAKTEAEATAAAAKAKAEAEAAAKKKQEEEQAKNHSTPGGRALNHAQLLAKALKQCKKEVRHAKRQKCEKEARAKYGPVRKKSARKKGSGRS
jgi:hypothetical protein